jgi:hypothetical protein
MTGELRAHFPGLAPHIGLSHLVSVSSTVLSFRSEHFPFFYAISMYPSVIGKATAAHNESPVVANDDKSINHRQF